MEYIITKNEQFNSLEVAFNGKPSEEVRNALKSIHYKWHSVKKVWYGYSDEETLKSVLSGEKAKHKEVVKTIKKTEIKPIHSLKVGDLLYGSWGYEQTNVTFVQVVALVGKMFVKVREVSPAIEEEKSISWASCDRRYKVTNEILPPLKSSVFVRDQENGDNHKVISWGKDKDGNEQWAVRLDSVLTVHKYNGGTVYESWYY